MVEGAGRSDGQQGRHFNDGRLRRDSELQGGPLAQVERTRQGRSGVDDLWKMLLNFLLP